MSTEVNPTSSEPDPMGQGFCLDDSCKEQGPTHLHGDFFKRKLLNAECVGLVTDVPEVERLLDQDDTVRNTARLLAAGYTVEQLEACARLARELADETRGVA